MSEQPAHVLSYESRADAARPWGPWLWRPSVVPIVLAAVVVGMGVWVHARHAPWTAAARFPVGEALSATSSLLFAGSERLILIEESTVHLWDVPARRHVSTVHLPTTQLAWSPTHRRNVLWGIRRMHDGSIVAWATNEVISVIDPMDGRIKRQITMPTGNYVVDVSPRCDSVIAEGPDGTLGVWSINECAADMPERRIGAGALASFSPEGQWMGFFGDDRRWHIMDAAGSEQLVVPRSFLCDWHADILVACGKSAGGPIESWSVSERRIVASVPTGPDTPCAVVLSPDQRRLVALLGQRSGPATGLAVWEYPSLRPISSNGALGSDLCLPEFFPDGRRVLVNDWGVRRSLVVSTDVARPLALLDGLAERTTISPDGNTIATLSGANEVILWRKVGYECRESILGILGMPHVWGLIGAGLLLALVTWRDARRGRGSAGAMMSAASLAMVLVGAGMSLALFLEWCIGRREPNVGPALLLCGLGLATTGRGWRWIAILALAGCLALGAWGLQAMFWGGLQHDVWLRILDRVWEVPSLWPFAALSAGLAAAAGAIVIVARRAS